ncbi:hypothetical protein [Streptomyces graminilatus]|uniref:hypothetical protein n=1 Tax=Streptomyces graminilatus TaxID=1464070 RepID=UPI00099F3617|nr:hypothetical protein [Streptomyces graminilatus]
MRETLPPGRQERQGRIGDLAEKGADAAPDPAGVPARNGLTAAQVRGTTGPNLAPAPATGWPAAQSWPNAAGMGQAG